jgi:hypothetical protein
MARYEGSPEDNAEDARGQAAMDRRVKVKPHHRRPAGSLPPRAPMPGPNEFDAGQEQAMRHGARAARMAPPPVPGDDESVGLGGL